MSMNVKSDFNRQEAVTKEIVDKVKGEVEMRLIQYFNDYKEEFEKQAVIEAAQELGFNELALELISII